MAFTVATGMQRNQPTDAAGCLPEPLADCCNTLDNLVIGAAGSLKTEPTDPLHLDIGKFLK